MKKLFTFLAACISFSAVAQSLYIKPTIGAGRTGILSPLGIKPEKAMFFKGELAVGIQINRIRLETGLGYLNPGYKLKGLVFENNIDPTTGQLKHYTDLDLRFSYLYLPVRAACKFDIGGGLSIVPAAGFAAMYNIRAEQLTTLSGVSGSTSQLLDANNIGVFADAMVYAEYKLGIISVTAGASYKHMMTEGSVVGNNRFYFFSADAGILYHF